MTRILTPMKALSSGVGWGGATTLMFTCTHRIGYIMISSVTLAHTHTLDATLYVILYICGSLLCSAALFSTSCSGICSTAFHGQQRVAIHQMALPSTSLPWPTAKTNQRFGCAGRCGHHLIKWGKRVWRTWIRWRTLWGREGRSDKAAVSWR